MKGIIKTTLLCIALTFSYITVYAQAALLAKMDAHAKRIEEKMIEWRRDFHQFPELGNSEFRTAAIIAKHLQSLGLVVTTEVAKTGVVAVLKGGKPGPVIALRADIDGLPITERTPIPFASTAKGIYNNAEVGVMHACGHDTHIAILMAVAEILTENKKDLKGTIKFIFQPAEEGPPVGEEGGAELMVKEGVLKNPDVDVIFGLHINSQTEVGKIRYRPGGTMASVSDFSITVKGKQTHGAYPWSGIDPIVTSAQIINALQTIVSRNMNLLENPAVVTVGSIQGGVRSNIIPEEVVMIGTIRALDTVMENQIYKRVHEIATKIAESAGAEAVVKIPHSIHYPVTYNDPALTQKMLASLESAAGKENVILSNPVTGAEDFSFFQEQIPGLYFSIGGMSKGKKPSEVAPHHTPDFFIDEAGLITGVKAFLRLVVDYMNNPSKM